MTRMQQIEAKGTSGVARGELGRSVPRYDSCQRVDYIQAVLMRQRMPLRHFLLLRALKDSEMSRHFSYMSNL